MNKMGIMECNRKDCERILCDTLISTRDREYYICQDCEMELTIYLEKMRDSEMTRNKVFELIDEFMRTPVGTKLDIIVDPIKVLNDITEKRNDW